MTKKCVAWLVLLFVFCSLTVTAWAAPAGSTFCDEVGVVTSAEAEAITQRLEALCDTYKVQVCIAVVETTGELSADRYVEKYYDSHQLGYGPDRDGVLLLVVMEDQQYRIVSNGFGAEAVSSGEIDSIGEKIAPYLSDADYAEAFDIFIDQCSYQIDGEINGFPFRFGFNLLISVGIGLVLALIITGGMKKKLKSVRMRATANDYTKPGSMQIHYSNDFFLYRTVNRVRKENNSSRSSGPSRNVGGGSF